MGDSQKIERSKLKEGDHIYSWRSLGAYSHHGIYIGNDRVIHFVNPRDPSTRSHFPGPSLNFSSSTRRQSAPCPKQLPNCGLEKVHGSGVKLSCLDCFLKKGKLRRFKYGVDKVFLILQLRGGTCTTAESDPIEEVIYRATYLHEHGYEKYDLMDNNCEDFALYCKTGLLSNDISYQGKSSQANMVRKTTHPNKNCANELDRIGDFLRRVTTAIPRSFKERFEKDLGQRDDVKKVRVEEMASFIQSLKSSQSGG